eukprot:6490255-Amphidinium_carterae.3
MSCCVSLRSPRPNVRCKKDMMRSSSSAAHAPGVTPGGVGIAASACAWQAGCSARCGRPHGWLKCPQANDPP